MLSLLRHPIPRLLALLTALCASPVKAQADLDTDPVEQSRWSVIKLFSPLHWPRQLALPPAWVRPSAAATGTTNITANLLPPGAWLDDPLAQGRDGAEGESLWLDDPGEQLETEVAFSQAFSSLVPDYGDDHQMHLGAGAYGRQQVVAMGWFRRLSGNTLFNLSLSSEPDLADAAARGGIVIHW